MCCDGRETPDCAAAGDKSPDVDVAAPLLERRRREQHGDQPARVALELAALARGVAVAEDQQVELRRGIAALVQLDAAARRPAPAPRAMNLSAGSSLNVQTSRNTFRASRFLTTTRTGCVGRREAQRLGERPVHLLRFARRLPFAVDRAEAARVEHACRWRRRRPRRGICRGWCRRSAATGLPGHGSGSITTRSRLKRSSFAFPVW